MLKFNIAKDNIEFKNLISGPAPIGRILNYIYLTENDKLLHQNGNRTTNLAGNKGSAWTTEFMIGLGLVRLGSPIKSAYKLELTDNGRQLYNAVKDNYSPFDEGFRDADIKSVKEQMNRCNPNLYIILKNSFIASYPFKILREYLLDNGFYYSNYNGFINSYFEAVMDMYEASGSKYIQDAHTTTGENRVPSLLQLCKLLGYLSTTDGNALKFNKQEFVTEFEDELNDEYNDKELKQAAAEEEMLIKIATKDLIEAYGEDGNVIVSAIVRNSSLQAKFKHNLAVEQGGRCVLCGMDNKSLLIGSHIKASATCSVEDKINHNNGLLLCCNHDKIFDRHLITFDCETGAIRISKSISADDIKRLSLDSSYKLPNKLLSEERKSYLKMHNMLYDEIENN